MGVQQSSLRSMLTCGVGKRKKFKRNSRNEDYAVSDEESTKNNHTDKNAEPKTEPQKEDLLEKGQRKRSQQRKETYFSAKQKAHYKKMREYEKKKRKTVPVAGTGTSKMKWREGQILGHGSFGTVLWGFDERKNIQMAVKKVYLGGTSDVSEKVKALEQEISLLSQLHHKNIVKYYGSEQKTESINIFLEYVEMIQKYAPLSEQLVRLYTKQILKGLEYLHSHKVIHRDIKAANVLVDRKGICKLADFGTSKMILGIDGKLNSLKGTANWMAPEVIQQTPYGRYADIWSLGCTVYEMVTGWPPWHDVRSIYEVMNLVVNSTELPEFPEDVGSDCQDFIECCLRRVPEERLNVYQLLRHPFIVKEQNNEESLQLQIERDFEEKAKIESEKEPLDFQYYLDELRKDNFFSKKQKNGRKPKRKKIDKEKVRLKLPVIHGGMVVENKEEVHEEADLMLRLNSDDNQIVLIMKKNNTNKTNSQKGSRERKEERGAKRKRRRPSRDIETFSKEEPFTDENLTGRENKRTSKDWLNPGGIKSAKIKRRSAGRSKSRRRRKKRSASRRSPCPDNEQSEDRELGGDVTRRRQKSHNSQASQKKNNKNGLYVRYKDKKADLVLRLDNSSASKTEKEGDASEDSIHHHEPISLKTGGSKTRDSVRPKRFKNLKLSTTTMGDTSILSTPKRARRKTREGFTPNNYKRKEGAFIQLKKGVSECVTYERPSTTKAGFKPETLDRDDHLHHQQLTVDDGAYDELMQSSENEEHQMIESQIEPVGEVPFEALIEDKNQFVEHEFDGDLSDASVDEEEDEGQYEKSD